MFLMLLSFSIRFWNLFLTIGCRPCGKAGASAHLEKTRFRSENVSNLAFRPFARTAKKLRNKAKKEEGKQTQNTINTSYGTKTKNNQKKMEPTWLPKSIPEASGGLFGASLAPRGSENRFRRPPGAQKTVSATPRGARSDV